MKRLFLFCLVTYCVQFANAQFSGKGSGTEEDPYLVTSALNVDEIRYFQGKEGVVFKLMNDIDMSGFIEDTYANAGWNPIQKFQGEFDGNGHTISGLFIYRPEVEKVGFFREISGSSIHDLILVYDGDIVSSTLNSSITAYAGGLSASVEGSNIERCMVKAINIVGEDVGGLIGRASSSEVTECIVECIQIKGDFCGGLVGSCDGCQINNNRVQTNVTLGQVLKGFDSIHSCGGIVGCARHTSRKTYAFCNLFEGNVYDESSSHTLKEHFYVGGIAGDCSTNRNVAISDSIIIRSLITDYSSYIHVGRICGSGGASPTSTNANKAYSKTVIKKGIECSYATDSENDGMGIGEILLKNENMYRNMGWDMDNVWTIDDGNSYPRLKWEVEKEMDKHKLIITNQGKEINDNDELTFLAEKVTTNWGGRYQLYVLSVYSR